MNLLRTEIKATQAPKSKAYFMEYLDTNKDIF